MSAPTPSSVTVHAMSGVPSVTITGTREFGGSGDKLVATIMAALASQFPNTIHTAAK